MARSSWVLRATDLGLNRSDGLDAGFVFNESNRLDMLMGAKKLAMSTMSDLDEVDAFDANREKVLLEQAGDYLKERDDAYLSDEEVMGLPEAPSESEGEDAFEDGDEDEDEDEGWGSKGNYYGGDDASDTEQSKQMAEEAAKQQRKHMEELAMDDFMDEDMMEDWQKAAETHDAADKPVVELAKSLKHLSKDDKLEVLTTSFPEFIPLVKEFTSLSVQLGELGRKNDQVSAIKHVALSTYLGAIASYFALFSDNLQEESFLSMKDSPVMETILSSREVWRQASQLADIKEVAVSEGEVSGSEAEVSVSSESESEDDFVDATQNLDSDNEIIDISKKRVIKKVADRKAGDFAETALDDVDREEKQRRKKTLRFYTSKIDQASQKNPDKYGGDADLPYRERLFERQQRLVEEARKRGLGQGPKLGDDLDGEEMASEDERVAHEVNDDDDYYDQVKLEKQHKKHARKQAHEIAVKAAKEGQLAAAQEELGDDGKRALNFQILKNKGLTKHRKNIDRNARVKKRKKFEKAQKKLKSVRQVHQANSGPYEGEKTGIKKGLSRSVKFM